MNVTEAVKSRRSVRQFLDKPVDLETIRRVMDTARWAASGCNYQPWEASILTGEPLKELQAKLAADGPQKPEYDWTAPGQEEAYKKRLDAVSSGMFGAMGIAREDKAGRMAAMGRNVTSFDAPVLLLCYFPRLMKEAQWSDTGMWLQTVALLLREEGLDSCFQEFMGLYPIPSAASRQPASCARSRSPEGCACRRPYRSGPLQPRSPPAPDARNLR